MKSAEQNEKCWTKLLVGKKCFISNLLIKNAERRENGVKARVIKTNAARISIPAVLQGGMKSTPTLSSPAKNTLQSVIL